MDLSVLGAISALDSLALGAQEIGVVEGGASLEAETQVLRGCRQVLRTLAADMKEGIAEFPGLCEYPR
jgi:hypothetical protein